MIKRLIAYGLIAAALWLGYDRYKDYLTNARGNVEANKRAEAERNEKRNSALDRAVDARRKREQQATNPSGK
jgi:hypothetical protein